jgi:hypothetical protein
MGRLADAVRTGRALATTADDPDAPNLWAEDVAPSLSEWPVQAAAAAAARWQDLNLPLPADCTVIDLGCGSGVDVFPLVDLAPRVPLRHG